jgi:hypothetical protein
MPSPSPSSSDTLEQVSSNLTPLGIILKTMRARYSGGDVDGALALAKIAAPYMHPRMTSTTPAASLADLTDAELDALLRND